MVMLSKNYGVGESSSPPRTAPSFGGYDVRDDVFNRLVETGNEEFVSNAQLQEVLNSHFNSLPSSYALDINMDRVDDVLMHHKLLTRAKNPDNKLVFHVRFVETLRIRAGANKEELSTSVLPTLMHRTDDKETERGIIPSQNRNLGIDFEPCSKLEDLNLDVRRNSTMKEAPTSEEVFRGRQESVLVHEVIFSTVDKPKLLSQLSALLSDIGLNIREAHVFSTTDGYSLDVFVVDGWPVEDTNDLHEAVDKAIARSELSWSGSSHSQSAALAQAKPGDWDIDVGKLNIHEKIASGSCGDLFRATYCGQDVAVKVLRSENLNKTLEDEFAHEADILREVQHRNVVRFIGSCTKPPHLCIVTEFMPGGSLFDYLHRNDTKMELSQLVKFAIDVVKVADFGIARFQNQGGQMTAETGTYRWMAPEIPYDTMTPLQAAVGVRQGLRPHIPKDAHPKLVDLMQNCWENSPGNRPSFSEIRIELEKILQESGVPSGAPDDR
ncbi:hypothetical protein AG4045_012451 [Apium graveolens]|uniref:non-specific serine/threonine protein kinase n=1 Tax=Apium graveolens TaxID=4045 RepID=A0A6L5BCX5_APIGR|nr:hypothetical protein AG4045_012451 [Apium graveolens]